MFIDTRLEFSESQAVTASTKSTNTVNQEQAGDVYAAMWLVIMVDETVAAVGDATVNFKLRTSANADMNTAKSLFETGAIGKAALTAGTVIAKVRVPVGAEQYLDVYYDVANGPLTAGKFSAFLTPDVMVGH